MTHSLDPVVFWRLRAACGDTQRLQVIAQTTMEALKLAQKKQDDLVIPLALEYGFDPKSGFQLDDDTLTMFLPEGAALMR